ncbi:ecto-ADP-ribosyltransferase 5-like [Dromiciops gliroides]|uniref:ecto-ADP-ribosyltransferase 5-like n=1 Tax=Dromiciops gliroides TaxID=33562 RepID=UPI001CC4A677|nr:ecto-ADP-ribosyltransferase 5-like [Dromiciops gliroides]
MKYTRVISIVPVLMFQLITSGVSGTCYPHTPCLLSRPRKQNRVILGLSQKKSREKVELPENVISLENKAFDDQYVGCEETMKIKAEGLLAQERAKNSNFNKVWEKAEKKWENKSTGKKKMEKPFEVAVIAYTISENKFYSAFNRAVRECCESREAYIKNFHFKAFHFYLTRAVQILRGPCGHVYRGISVKQYPNGKRKMRFGQFASASLDKDVARRFTRGSGTLYKVNTCEGAPIEYLSVFPNEKEVLIPPYELFSVSNSSDSKGLENIELKSKERKSKFNCAYIRFQYSRRLHVCGYPFWKSFPSAPGNKAAGPGQLTTIFSSRVFTLVF